MHCCVCCAFPLGFQFSKIIFTFHTQFICVLYIYYDYWWFCLSLFAYFVYFDTILELENEINGCDELKPVNWYDVEWLRCFKPMR